MTATFQTDLLTTAEFAESVGDLAPDTVKKYCQRGIIAGVKLGRSWLIPKAEVTVFRKNRKPVGKPRNTG